MVVVKSKGKIYAELSKPAVVYDNLTFTVLKIGELNEMQDVYAYLKQRYEQVKLLPLIDSLAILELPCDEVIVNNVFNITGYLKDYLKDK